MFKVKKELFLRHHNFQTGRTEKMIANPLDYEIIDAHTHPFLDFKMGCIGPYGKPETMAEFDFEMHKVGIGRYAGAPLVKKKISDFKDVISVNEDALKIRDKYPSYIPGIHVHGAFPQESCELLHKMYQNEEIRYIGELVPYIMDTGAFDSPGMLTIFKEAGKLGMTVNLHGGTPAEADAMLENAPGLNIILAHPGEPANAKPRFEYVKTSPRLHIDISAHGPFRWNMIRYAIDCCGVEKIIFGSDMPTCSAGMFLYSVMTENLSEDERKLILAGNFKRLLGIK